jgi:hypothetical protein
MFVALLLLYGSPDVVMPIASALAAIIGVLLMLWNRAASYIRGFAQSLRRRPQKLPARHSPSTNRRVTGRDHTS